MPLTTAAFIVFGIAMAVDGSISRQNLVKFQCRELARYTMNDQRRVMLSPCPPLCTMLLGLGQLCKLLVSCGRRTSVIQTS
jgi:hypothetical protein